MADVNSSPVRTVASAQIDPSNISPNNSLKLAQNRSKQHISKQFFEVGAKLGRNNFVEASKGTDSSPVRAVASARIDPSNIFQTIP